MTDVDFEIADCVMNMKRLFSREFSRTTEWTKSRTPWLQGLFLLRHHVAKLTSLLLFLCSRNVESRVASILTTKCAPWHAGLAVRSCEWASNVAKFSDWFCPIFQNFPSPCLEEPVSGCPSPPSIPSTQLVRISCCLASTPMCCATPAYMPLECWWFYLWISFIFRGNRSSDEHVWCCGHSHDPDDGWNYS